MRVPTIHMNGTSRERLLEGVTESRRALREAIDKVAQSAPHGRDYYPQGDDALREATSEHQARLEKLREVYNELSHLGEEIANAGK